MLNIFKFYHFHEQHFSYRRQFMVRSLFLTLCFCLFSLPVLAITFGPVTPETKQGEISLGPGFFHLTGELEDGQDFTSSQVYVQLGYGLTDRVQLVFAGGAADLTVDDVFGSDDFEENYRAFGAAGIKVMLHEGAPFGFGFFAQGLFSDDFEDGLATFSDNLEINSGFSLQAELEGALLYGGPFYYMREGDVEVAGVTGDYEEDGGFGGFIGISWPLANGFTIGLEGQRKSGTSVGGTILYTF
jgi:hypothetical protein